MPISTRTITNIGSPPADPTCVLHGILYVPDGLVHPQPWHCVVGTVAAGFKTGGLNPLIPPFTDLANAGYLCLAHDVRIIPPPGLATQTTSGVWHQQTDDLKIGIRAMRSNPFSFGYAVTGKVFTLGGSGSSHHAVYAALDGTLGDDKSDGAIGMSVPTDFSNRNLDVTQPIIDIITAYGDSSDLPTLRSRSPIGMNLAAASPILHYNGQSEVTGYMPLSMLTTFRDAIQATAGGANYSYRINTGFPGRFHSFQMWPYINTDAIAWLGEIAAGQEVGSVQNLLTSDATGVSGQYQKHFIH